MPEKPIQIVPEKPAAVAPAAAPKPITKPIVQPQAPKKKPKKKVRVVQLEIPKVISVEDKNKEADTAYLEWLVKDQYSFLSPSLRKILNDKAIAYLINESSLSFNKYWDAKTLNEKIRTVAARFIKKFGLQGKITLSELQVLIRKLMAPERVFQADGPPLGGLNRMYNSFMHVLSDHITPVNTTLEEWALRFLTSESMLIALPFIAAIDKNGRSFNEIDPHEKEKALEPVVEILTQRFLNNLQPVQQKYAIAMPGRMDEVIKNKLRRFLYEKFVSTL